MKRLAVEGFVWLQRVGVGGDVAQHLAVERRDGGDDEDLVRETVSDLTVRWLSNREVLQRTLVQRRGEGGGGLRGDNVEDDVVRPVAQA